MAEKGLEFELSLEKVWEQRIEFLSIDPAGEVPVLIEIDGAVIAGANSILEYLEDTYEDLPLIGHSPTRKHFELH